MVVRAEHHDGEATPVVGGYRLERIAFEEPGFHVLYDGVDADSGEHVSVKVFVIEPERRMARQFVRAARRRAAVEHPHLLKIHGASEWEGRLLLATEPSDLLTVAEGLKGGAFTPGETIEILSEVAAALDAAAEAGIVDHELSPATILLDRSRGALLADLGVVTSLSEGLPPWAYPYPQHIAPEIVRGEPLEPRSNVYSLGSVMLECLTGSPPFEGSLQTISNSHAAEPPPRASERDPSLGEEIDAVLAVALAKAPADRFATSRQLVDAAARALGVAPAQVISLPVSELETELEPEPEIEPETETEPAAPPVPEVVQASVAPRASRFPWPHVPRRLRLALVAVAAAAAIVVAGYLTGHSNDGPRAVAAPAPPAEPAPELVDTARTIGGTVGRLDRGVGSGRARLATARTPAGQARIATGVSRAYLAAAAEAGAVGAPRGLDPSALREPLADASRGYARLARAARAQNRRAFRAARGDIRAAEAALRRELAALR